MRTRDEVGSERRAAIREELRQRVRDPDKDAQSCADFMYQEVGTYPLVQKTGPINCYNEHILILMGLTCIHDCFISNVLRFCPFEL